MPRNAQGIFTLDPSNPVAPDTVISTIWANPTMEDIGDEITNSLDRNGRGGMNAPLLLEDGTDFAPAITFRLQPTVGFYRPAVNNLAMVINSSEIMRWSDVQVTVNEVDFLHITGTNEIKIRTASVDFPFISLENLSDTTYLSTEANGDSSLGNNTGQFLLCRAGTSNVVLPNGSISGAVSSVITPTEDGGWNITGSTTSGMQFSSQSQTNLFTWRDAIGESQMHMTNAGGLSAKTLTANSLVGGGLTGASIDNNGQLVRT